MLVPDFSILLLQVIEKCCHFSSLGKSVDNLALAPSLSAVLLEWCMWLWLPSNRELWCFAGISQGYCIRKLLQPSPQNPWEKKVKRASTQDLEVEAVLWFGCFLVDSGDGKDLGWILISPPAATFLPLSSEAWFSWAQDLGERPCGYMAFPGTFVMCSVLHSNWK